jgi:hypothetical protein
MGNLYVLSYVRANCLALCSPAPARNRKQEKQRGTVKETRVGNVSATRNTIGCGWRINILPGHQAFPALVTPCYNSNRSVNAIWFPALEYC